MVLLAFDDTDSRAGGCTTHLAYELIRRLRGADLIGAPRLVRLNPSIPHKTRGNGAVALVLGHGHGTTTVVGRDAEGDIVSYAEGEDLTDAETKKVFHEAERLIGSSAKLEADGTNPGLVAFREPPPRQLYESAVTRYVGQAEAGRLWRPVALFSASWKLGRGLLGAAAAAAWPAQRITYEWIAYRHPARWGTPRELSNDLGPSLDRHHPSTFDNYDAEHAHLRVAPASPCPILAGIRGTDPQELSAAARRVGPEETAGGLLFASNQATDDQFRPALVRDLRPFTSPVLVARVLARPREWKGGHVFVHAADATGELDLAAFEPTKQFRHAARALRVGDAVRIHGSVQSDPRLVALERLELLEAAPRRRPNTPECGTCGVRMKNRGRGEPHRCPKCGRDARPALVEAKEGARGVWEVPVAVRRHLTRPLALGV